MRDARRKIGALAEYMAELMELLGTNGMKQLTEKERNLFNRVNSSMCWDAAIVCAWTAGGVECERLAEDETSTTGLIESGMPGKFYKLFPQPWQYVEDAIQLRELPVGCFIGFLKPENVVDPETKVTSTAPKLAHVMLHTQDRFGAGTKNRCVLKDGKDISWEILDISLFFTEDYVEDVKMIWAEPKSI